MEQVGGRFVVDAEVSLDERLAHISLVEEGIEQGTDFLSHSLLQHHVVVLVLVFYPLVST